MRSIPADPAAWSELLARVPGLDSADLRRLLRLHQHRHWRGGWRPSAETYREQLPRLQTEDDLLVEVVCGRSGPRGRSARRGITRDAAFVATAAVPESFGSGRDF